MKTLQAPTLTADLSTVMYDHPIVLYVVLVAALAYAANWIAGLPWR